MRPYTMNGFKKMFFVFLLLSAVLNQISALRFIEQPSLNCSQKELLCSVHLSRAKCSDEGWVKPRSEAPGFPIIEKRSPNVLLTTNEREEIVLYLTLIQRADDNIYSLKGTEVHVLEGNTNRSLCVRYIFNNTLSHFSKWDYKHWSFVFSQIVLEAGLRYKVWVSNLPKPDVGEQSELLIVPVPGCDHEKYQRLKVCLENGSLWNPNLTWSVSDSSGSSKVIFMTFNTGQFSDRYRVNIHHPDLPSNLSVTVSKDNQASISMNFSLDACQFKCCDLVFVIKPFFLRCMNNCLEYQKNVQICSDRKYMAWIVLCLAVLFFFFTIGLLHINSHMDTHSSSHVTKDQPKPAIVPAQKPSKILIIYSLDHPLYKEIVLKLCAFLRDKCGADVTLDLLDSTCLSTIGCIQWLDMQRERLSSSSDKVLILCSPGVYAKWKAMCGGKKVVTREDAHSPMGDMLTPALSLIVPAFVHALSFQKYVVAYFEDVCSENDVPAPLNIAVKYNLMKHFEELFFRLLDMEKHEPGRMKLVEGIGRDDYHTSPSGRALRDAIVKFREYQHSNQNWFELELVDADEEVEKKEKCDRDEEINCKYGHPKKLQHIRMEAPVFINQPISQMQDTDIMINHAYQFSLNEDYSSVPCALTLCNQISQMQRPVKDISDKSTILI